jgi:small redox-active disulfide protein 2
MEHSMIIKILGSGCKKCITLGENTQAALANLGREAQVLKVTDITEIAAHGVMSTPALVVDDKVVSVGKVLTTAEVEKLLCA